MTKSISNHPGCDAIGPSGKIAGGSVNVKRFAFFTSTDFDMVRETPKEGDVHLVGTTPEYAPGFIWSAVTDQRLPHDDQTMKKIAEAREGRVIYRMPKPIEGIPGYLLLYPPRKEANKKIQEAIANLEAHHPQKELKALRSLVELSYRCKKEDPKKLLSMEEVTIRLRDIQHHRLELTQDY